jgi:hypothetical protein
MLDSAYFFADFKFGRKQKLISDAKLGGRKNIWDQSKPFFLIAFIFYKPAMYLGPFVYYLLSIQGGLT